MKFLFSILFSVISFSSFSQYYIKQTFESPFDSYRGNFYIDTVNCSNNKWQMGKPQKTIFDSAYSYPNAIVTDTLYQYPANDTSIFYFTMWGDYHAMLTLEFQYRLDIDSLSTATVEISGDNGANWINPIIEDSVYLFYWGGGVKPRLDTSSDGWRLFKLNMDTWSYAHPGSHHSFPLYRTSDTMIYRFTFISGGDTSVHRDGWMMDNFESSNVPSVALVGTVSDVSLNIYPNPTNGIINLHTNFNSDNTDRVVVYNMQGQQVYETTLNSGKSIHLPLANGVYTLRYFGSAGVATEKVVIMH